MMYEYAVDPALFTTVDGIMKWKPFFGRNKGRLIAYYPEEWRNLASREASSPMTKKRLDTLLEEMLKRRTLFRCNRCDYKAGLAWWQNAYNQHVRSRPFRAIITNEPTKPDDGLLHVDDAYDEDHPRMAANTEAVVPRTAQNMAKIAQPLLALASCIRFVDPHFDPHAPRYLNTLSEFLKAATSGKVIPVKQVEYHLDGGTIHDGQFKTWCHQNVPRLLPPGIGITFYRWREMASAESLHPRYILTDIAGLSFEHGLDAETEHQTCDVKLIAAEIFDRRWNQYRPDGTAFVLKDSVAVK